MAHETNHRILVVDDNQAIHEDFRKVIGSKPGANNSLDEAAQSLFGDSAPAEDETERFEIDSAYQGQEALKLVQQSIAEGRPYAVAFVDVRMPPGWDGVETVKHLWAADPRLQVVICSAYSDYSWSEMVRLLGKTDKLLILKKPFDNIEVRQIASALREKWELASRDERTLERLHAMVNEQTRELQELNNQLQQKIADQLRSESALRASEARKAAILKTAVDCIVTTDEHGCIIEFNPAAERTFGYSAADAIGKNLAELILARWQGAGSNLKLAPDAEKSVLGKRFESTAQRSDGNVFPVEVCVTTLMVEDSPIYITFMRDVTERRKLEAQLTQAQKLEAVGQLAAGIAHEINTPTQYVGDNTQFLRDAFGELTEFLNRCERLIEAAQSGSLPPDLTAETQELLGEIDLDYLKEEIPKAIDQSLEGIHRVSQIVRSMKDFAYQGHGQMVAHDLNRALESTITVARNEWKYVADVETDFEPDLPMVMCRPGDINQVFLNLIVNAAHAIADVVGDGSQGQGTIRVSTRRDADRVEIRISDTGTGIPEAIHSRIFDPFFTTKQVGKGTGQGLAIAHTVIVEKHSGELTFETETGKGTTFIVRLPICQTANREEADLRELIAASV